MRLKIVTGVKSFSKPEQPQPKKSKFLSAYKDLKIERGATVTFTQGVYNFKSFTIGNDATALFDFSLDKTIEINIETSP